MTGRDVNMPVTISDIDIPDGRRDIVAGSVKSLADSINKVGLRHPITVQKKGDRYILVAGRHRIEAYKKLGLDHIPATIVTMTNGDARLWEIAENLHRTELSKLERDDNIAKWIRITEGVSRQVDAKPQGGRPEGGVRAAARGLGIDEVDARRAVKVAALAAEAKEAARDAGLENNRSVLLSAAKEKTPAAQVNVIKGIAAAKHDTRKKKKSRKPRFVAPKSTPEQRDEFDLQGMEALWENASDNARAAFLETARHQHAPRSAPTGRREAICASVKEAILLISGKPPAHEVARWFAGTDSVSIISEHLRPAAAWLADFNDAWKDEE